MAISNDGHRSDQPLPEAAARSDQPSPEQTFFSDPVLDRLLAMTMTLAAELYILRCRVGRLEAAQGGATGAADGDARSGVESEAERQDAAAFVAHLLQPFIGEQQAKGPR